MDGSESSQNDDYPNYPNFNNRNPYGAPMLVNTKSKVDESYDRNSSGYEKVDNRSSDK